MNQIKSGIRIFDRCADPQVDRPRAFLNDGTAKATDMVGKQRYCPYAYIPKGKWRELSPAERELLWVTDEPSSSNQGDWISIVRVPDEVLSPFEEIQIVTTKHNDESAVWDLCDSPESQRGIAQVKEYLTSFIASSEPLNIRYISTKPPERLTTTHDDRNKCYVGLHVDSFYMRPLRERHLSPNRFCINLGPEDRFLLFMNLPLLEMFDLLETEKSKDPSTLGWAFMRRFPNYPIVSLRIAPKEAYIAPTEAIIHDGTTLGKRYIDVNLTILGHFKPSVNASS